MGCELVDEGVAGGEEGGVAVAEGGEAEEEVGGVGLSGCELHEFCGGAGSELVFLEHNFIEGPKPTTVL